MLENNLNPRERAILVAIKTDNCSDSELKEYIEELERLADTAGADTIFKVTQERSSPDYTYFIGKGKVEYIESLVEENNIDIIIFDDDLSPVQMRNLEQAIKRKVIDRSGLILDIFASRAKTKEAKTQVELAQMQYTLSRLTRAWTHLSKQYGGIGSKGPGETQIETDRRIIRYRIQQLRAKLTKIEDQRKVQTQHRDDFYRAALVGYTNAGKSTLFNELTDAGTFAEDKLFATLDSTTRMLSLKHNFTALMSDTVGFIRKLPAHLVASFQSTLMEVREADLILHVIDATHPYFEDHIRIVRETLKTLECDQKPELLVFNKIDAFEDKDTLRALMQQYPEAVFISAARGIHVTELIRRIEDFAQALFVTEEIELPIGNSRALAVIHQYGEVVHAVYDEEKMMITFKASKTNTAKIKGLLHAKKNTRS